MPKASPRRSTSATTWSATSLLAKISDTLDQYVRGNGGMRRDRRSSLVTVAAFGRARLRQLPAGARPHQRRPRPQMVDTIDEWIVQRTGIRERHIAAPGEMTSDLGLKAAQAALADAGLEPADDRPDRARDRRRPTTPFRRRAVSIQAGLGIHHGAAFDLQAVCSGFVYALATADGLLRERQLQARAGDRRGDLFAHPRLDRPHHLRAVRRRRRRRRGRGAAAGRRQQGSRRPDLAPALRRALQDQALCRRRPVLDRHGRPPAHGRARGVPARGRR